MPKSPYSPEWKAMVAHEYLDGKESSYALANRYELHPFTIRTWAQRYKEQGVFAFVRQTGNSKYTSDFKKECVKLYICGEMSVDEIVAKYNISCRYVLQKWILRYNANRELKDYDPKREVYMAEARRKTSIEERKKIVEYCIAHNRDYKGTASLFDVSYSQVYSWIKKYDINGEDGLLDKRGHHVKDDEADELKCLRRENLRLKRKLQESEMSVELLKKVKEFEGM